MDLRSSSPRLALVGLILASLGCDAVLENFVGSVAQSPVSSVEVNPTSGAGPYRATVRYHAFEEGGLVHCEYPDATGLQTLTHVSSPPSSSGDFRDDFEFSVDKAGQYSVKCFPYGRPTQSVSANFTKGEAAAPAETFTSATLVIEWLTATAKPGSEVYIFSCEEVELTVSPEGALAGECTKAPIDSQQSPVTGKLIGQWNQATGEVTFLLPTHMNVTGVPDASEQAVWDATVEATALAPGKLSGALASGKATWKSHCEATPRLLCYNLLPVRDEAGEVNWSMVFGP